MVKLRETLIQLEFVKFNEIMRNSINKFVIIFINLL